MVQAIAATPTVAPSGEDILSQLVVKRTQMTISELMPYLNFTDLAHFYQLNKTCKRIFTPVDLNCLRFNVLFAKRCEVQTEQFVEW